MPIVRVSLDRVTDWDSFHTRFAEVLGFPDFYGRNMNAWVDCLTSADHPEDGMTTVVAGDGDVVVEEIRIEDAEGRGAGRGAALTAHLSF